LWVPPRVGGGSECTDVLNSFSSSFMPFLNSTRLRPSDRATDGRRLPNKRMATMPKISMGTALRPIIEILPPPIEPPNFAHSSKPGLLDGRLLRLVVIGLVFNLFEATLEFGNALSERACE